ncbi:hypothetical protein, partial [Lactobacillus paragasseri]
AMFNNVFLAKKAIKKSQVKIIMKHLLTNLNSNFQILAIGSILTSSTTSVSAIALYIKNELA